MANPDWNEMLKLVAGAHAKLMALNGILVTVTSDLAVATRDPVSYCDALAKHISVPLAGLPTEMGQEMAAQARATTAAFLEELRETIAVRQRGAPPAPDTPRR